MEKPSGSEDSKQKSIGGLEVIGVSRSGRICKKSSKLIGYDSSDIESKPLKSKKAHKIDAKSALDTASCSKVENLPDIMSLPTIYISSDEEDLLQSPLVAQAQYPDEGEIEILQSACYNLPIDDIETGDWEGAESIVTDEPQGNLEENKPFHYESLILNPDEELDPMTGSVLSQLEPEQEILFPKEEILVSKEEILISPEETLKRRKYDRKDKGKRRFTGYMLWSKDIRVEIARQNPSFDFSQVNRTLGDMWACVPKSEKLALKKEAARLSAEARASSYVEEPVPMSEEESMEAPSTSYKPMSKFKKSASHGSLPALASASTSSTPMPRALSMTALSARIPTSTSSEGNEAAGGASNPPKISVLDIAAHFKILGESLEIIGARLTEHEGPVSGSFSVLLDSLLCALGSLMCLTQFIPEMNVVPVERHAKLMDDIAYIMPGL